MDAFPPRTVTPSRPNLPPVSASYSVGVPTPPTHDSARVGKFSNGSQSSLAAGSSAGSGTGFVASKKGSLASLRNAFTRSGGDGTAGAGSSNIPPVPLLDKQYGGPGYPALKNPFSRFDSPSSPSSSSFRPSSRGKTQVSPGVSMQNGSAGRKQSIATNHSSHRSQGTSQSSSSFQPDDYPIPILPPIPVRGSPSRMRRTASDAGSFFAGPSLWDHYAEGEPSESGNTATEEATRIVFRDFRHAADQKISRICARPLVSSR